MSDHKHNPLAALARELAHRDSEPSLADVVAAVHEDTSGRLLTYWVEAEILDNDDNASWVLSNVIDAIDLDNDGHQDRREITTRRLLDALARDQHAIVGKILGDALRRAVASEVNRRMEGVLFVERFTGPLRRSLDQWDAINRDRRALAREHNAQVQP